MFRALGLDTLKAEKEHFNVHVQKLPSTPLSTEVQEYIKFGSENEINAISTLIGLMMPALLPSCHSSFKVGPKFIHGVHRKNFIEVSGDGIIQCTKGDACEKKKLNPRRHKRIAVEAKSIFPSEDMPKFPYYKLPVRHVPQCLSEIVAYEADELWLIAFTLYSVSLIIVYFDQTLWDKLLNLAEEKYGVAKPVLPTRLHVNSKNLKEDLLHFVETHTRFVVEVPAF